MGGVSVEYLETSVLARALWDGEAAVSLADDLVPQDFVDPTAQALFTIIASLAASGKGADPVSLGVRLRTDGSPELVALYESLLTYDIQSVSFEVGPAELAEALRADTYARRFKDLISGAQLAIDRGFPIKKIEKRIEERLTALQAATKDDRTFDSGKKQTAEVIDFYYDKAAADAVLRWGFHSLDKYLMPPRPGNLVIIAGAPGAGKSTVARNLYAGWARRQRGVLFSLEMSGLEQRTYLAAMDSGVPVTAYFTRTMTTEQETAFGRALKPWEDGLLTINERAHWTPEQCLRAMARYLAQGCTFFCLDHLHRFDYGAVKDSDLRIPVGNFAQALKNFALTNKVVVLALAQIKKQSPSEEPDDSSIRETAKIAEEADAILFAYRPLVACTGEPDGSLRPIARPGGGRYFAHEKPKGSIMGMDEENVFLKPGKFRVAPVTALFRVPFHRETARMYDEQRY